MGKIGRKYLNFHPFFGLLSIFLSFYEMFFSFETKLDFNICDSLKRYQTNLGNHETDKCRGNQNSKNIPSNLFELSKTLFPYLISFYFRQT